MVQTKNPSVDRSAAMAQVSPQALRTKFGVNFAYF
jgi:hypothetical protein